MDWNGRDSAVGMTQAVVASGYLDVLDADKFPAGLLRLVLKAKEDRLTDSTHQGIQ